MKDLNISKVDASTFSQVIENISVLNSTSEKLRESLNAITSEEHAREVASMLVKVDTMRAQLETIAREGFTLIDSALAAHKNTALSASTRIDLNSINQLEQTFTQFADEFAEQIELPTHAYRLRLVPSLQVEAKLISGLVAQIDLLWPQDFSRIGQHIKSALRTIKQRNDIWTPLQLTEVVLSHVKNKWSETNGEGTYENLLPAYRVVVDQKNTIRYTDVLTGEFVEYVVRTSQRPNDNDVTKGWIALSAQVVKNHSAEELKDDDS